MSLTTEQIDQIPLVYRDFLLALRPVVETRDTPVRVTGIPRGRIYSVLRMRGHAYDLDEIASVLRQNDLVTEDRLGFFEPTAKGEALIRDMIGAASPTPAPPLPPLPY